MASEFLSKTPQTVIKLNTEGACAIMRQGAGLFWEIVSHEMMESSERQAGSPSPSPCDHGGQQL
jgi:hypothetical protein